MPTNKERSPRYNRILLKLSGEALAGDEGFGIDPKVLDAISLEIGQLVGIGVQVGLVVGGGNLFRGAALQSAGLDRVAGDHMGMLATVINCLALGDAIRRLGGKPRVFSNLVMPDVADHFTAREARKTLAEGGIAICSGGTGNPFFTTDTAAALKAVELECDALFKGTKVDGVYDADPEKHPDAKRFDAISYDEVISRDLKVMDMAAFALARDNKLPIFVYALDVPGGVQAIIEGKALSTRVG